MAQRVRNPYRRHSPSSARQLPILAALYAGFPTLFPIMIHETTQKVKQEFTNFSFLFPSGLLWILMKNFPKHFDLLLLFV